PELDPRTEELLADMDRSAGLERRPRRACRAGEGHWLRVEERPCVVREAAGEEQGSALDLGASRCHAIARSPRRGARSLELALGGVALARARQRLAEEEAARRLLEREPVLLRQLDGSLRRLDRHRHGSERQLDARGAAELVDRVLRPAHALSHPPRESLAF